MALLFTEERAVLFVLAHCWKSWLFEYKNFEDSFHAYWYNMSFNFIMHAQKKKDIKSDKFLVILFTRMYKWLCSKFADNNFRVNQWPFQYFIFRDVNAATTNNVNFHYIVSASVKYQNCLSMYELEIWKKKKKISELAKLKKYWAK